MRRTAEDLHSWMGHQERWLLWHPLAPAPQVRCRLAASSVHRWVDRAGQRAVETIPDQLSGIDEAEELGTDGLWAKLKGQIVRVVLMTVNSVTGLIYPPIVAHGEKAAHAWQQLFARAVAAGLDLQRVRGVTSDGAQGLLGHLRADMSWVEQQRCVWHVWRQLGRAIVKTARQATVSLSGPAAAEARAALCAALGELLHQIVGATSASIAEVALTKLRAHPHGADLAQRVTNIMDRLFIYQMAYTQRAQVAAVYSVSLQNGTGVTSACG